MGFKSLSGFYVEFFNKNNENVEESSRKDSGISDKFVSFSDWVKNTSFEESVFLAYGKPYRKLLFTVTFREMKMATSSFFKKEQMKVLQNYETLANIISMALGGGEKEPDNTYNIESVDQLQNALGSALNGR